MNKELLFIQLNEINFDLVDKYLKGSKKKFLNLEFIKKNYNNFFTLAEDEYKNQEPWIQWASVQLGKDFDSHGIFRLGDITKHLKQKQIFETIEDKGFKVGAISPMNAENRLKNPAYFIPDPWTETPSDDSEFSKRFSLLLKQSVNDNSSGKLSFRSLVTIFEIIFKTLHYRNTSFLISLIFSSIIKPWKKSLVLDFLIHLAHLHLYKKKKPNFSSVFLNAGAHIQHHYFYNTKFVDNLPKNPNWYIDPNSDPISDMLEVYDKILGDYVKLCKNGKYLLIATGLRQVPYDLIKFYYRLKNHTNFLHKIGIKFLDVLPRMTRDFEIIFETKNDFNIAKDILDNIFLNNNNTKIFGEIEEREKSLFVTLTYPHEIKKEDYIIINNNLKLNFFNEVSFVAIKNGKHDQKGYGFYSPNLDIKISKEPIHVSKIFNIISSIF